MAMAMAIAGKQKNIGGTKAQERGASGCCCFGWAVYAQWECHMNLRALYVSKLAKYLLVCPCDLVCDQLAACGLRL